MYDSQWTASYDFGGSIGKDYDAAKSQSYYNTFGATWFPNGPDGDGVWFASAAINKNANNQHYMDVYYTDGEEKSALQPLDAHGSPLTPFFRVHVTPQNMTNIANAINSRTGCVPACYSTNPADYELQYAGVIAEVRLHKEIDYVVNDPSVYDAGPGMTQFINNDANKDQVSLGVHVLKVGVYRGVPN